MRIYYIILFAIIAIACTTTKVQDDSLSIYHAISVQNKNDEPCNLNLILQGTKYEFKGETNAKGTYSLSSTEKEKFITFTGLKYAQVDDRYQDEDTDVSGLFSKDTIIIQNYGNSMNDFITLGVCDEKFIYLIRKKP